MLPHYDNFIFSRIRIKDNHQTAVCLVLSNLKIYLPLLMLRLIYAIPCEYLFLFVTLYKDQGNYNDIETTSIDRNHSGKLGIII